MTARQYPDIQAIDPRDEPIEAVVRPPGSKSQTNRALVLAALASGGVSKIHGPLVADDTEAMRLGLRALGVMIDDNDDPWLVLGSEGRLAPVGDSLDARGSGTTARFLTAVAALAPGTQTIDGSPRMRERPIGPVVSALTGWGVEASDHGGYPPARVGSGVLRAGRVEVDARRSSQFLSAVLMVAPMAAGDVDVVARGPVASRPYVESTVEMMRAFGADVDVRSAGHYRVGASGYRKTELDIEADASAAVYPMAATALVGGVVGIEGLPEHSLQPDLRIVEVLERMGCSVWREGPRLLLAGPSRRLASIDVDLASAPDGALAVAVLCMFADGVSRLRGLGTLRVKETDRLAALEVELTRLGARAVVEGDDLVIEPGSPQPGRVRTYDDHRMAMAFSLAGLRIPGIVIDDPGCVAKTWPGYFDMLARL